MFQRPWSILVLRTENKQVWTECRELVGRLQDEADEDVEARL